MTSLLSSLLKSKENRVLYEVDLEPVMGPRFQPTGFPDLGAAEYTDPKTGEQRLLVESAQSIANRLEATCWDESTNQLAAPLDGMPFVKVTGDADTCSILEAHRLNSPYIVNDESFVKKFSKAAGISAGKIDRSTYGRALLHFDPNSLVHGSFMSQVGSGTARLERMLSGFIEAEGVAVAASGGVKTDRNDVSGKDEGGAAKGFGSVPFHRTDYVAKRIYAVFSIDLAGLRGLRLPAPGANLALALCLYKMRALLDGPLRLRTSCDLELVDQAPTRVRPSGFELPSLDQASALVSGAIEACAKEALFADPVVTEVTFTSKKKKKK